MSSINEKEIVKIIRETLGTSSPKPSINEAYVLQPKQYSIETDLLSQKAVAATIQDFDETVKVCNEISAKLDSVDRTTANDKDSAFRELKSAESYNLNSAFLSSLHLDNIADPASKISMDSLAYIRLARDFGSFDDWQKDFIACAMSARDGYVATVYNGSLNRYMNVMIDESSAGIMMNCYPVICLCVKPQCYVRDYLNDRRSYVFAMMKELRWSLVEQRIRKADKLSKLLSTPLEG